MEENNIPCRNRVREETAREILDIVYEEIENSDLEGLLKIDERIRKHYLYESDYTN